MTQTIITRRYVEIANLSREAQAQITPMLEHGLTAREGVALILRRAGYSDRPRPPCGCGQCRYRSGEIGP